MAEASSDIGVCFMHNFSCKICLEVLEDPVQCKNNEHYFCRKCIAKHLHDNAETCPLCADQLTLETLRAVPRVILDIVSQIKKPRCSYVCRGCTENVKIGEQSLHEQTCGYAPVVCSNEGCEETVNRRDKQGHETEECKFRKATCESCAEEMVYHDYETHKCTLRKEINEIKVRLDEMSDTLKQVLDTQGKLIEKFKAYGKSIENLQDPLRSASSATIQRDNAVVVNGLIFLIGGHNEKAGKSVEVFNWSTKTWTLIRNCLFFRRHCSYSFLYGQKIMICGGKATDRIEYLSPKDGYTSNVFSCSVPRCKHCGVLCGNKVFSFYNNIREISLESLGESNLLVQEQGYRNCYARVHCFGRKIYVVGGKESSVEKYDVVKNVLQSLPPLPYKVSNMATVAYKDNIIILGGICGSDPLDDVLMFNLTNQEYKRLPSMLEERAGCAAVVMGDVIVVMGGEGKNLDKKVMLRTVEYYVMGHATWQQLPAMNLPREGATACSYV